MTEDQLVSDAVAIMAERNYRAMIVVDGDNKVKGIITERDVVKRIVGAGKNLDGIEISEIMTSNPSVAREDDEIEAWMKAPSQKRFRRIPVVGEDDRLLAILTQTDLIAYAWPALLSQTIELALRESRKMFYALLIGGGLLTYAIAIVVLAKVLF